MAKILKSALMILTLALPSQLFAQTIIDGPDAARMATLMRVNLCEKTCRAGKLTAQRHQNPNIALENGFKLYIVTTRNKRQCRGQSCQQALIAVNGNDLLTLAEGFKLNPSTIALPQRVAKTERIEPQRSSLCRKPGRRLNTALIRQTFVGKTAVGRNDRGQGWSEFLGLDLSAVLTNEAGRKLPGRFELARNQICARYGKGEFTCKAVYECSSGEGPFVFADDRDRLTGLVTRIVAGAAAPDPAPQATTPSEDVVAELARCRAVRSEIRRLNCYDALADNPPQTASNQFKRAERLRLLELMNFRNLSGVTLTETSLESCVMTIKVDAPEVRLSFSNEAVIDLRHLNMRKSRSVLRGQDALYSFVAAGRNAWPLKTIDKARNSERASRNTEALLAVTADPKDLAEVEGLIRKLAGVCQR